MKRKERKEYEEKALELANNNYEARLQVEHITSMRELAKKYYKKAGLYCAGKLVAAGVTVGIISLIHPPTRNVFLVGGVCLGTIAASFCALGCFLSADSGSFIDDKADEELLKLVKE